MLWLSHLFETPCILSTLLIIQKCTDTSSHYSGYPSRRNQSLKRNPRYVGGIEIRNPGPSETVLAYPHSNVRMTFKGNGAGGYSTDVSYLFRDQLNSVHMIADEA